MLEPDKGDDVFSYNHVVWKRDGKDVFALARMPNGDCYYLDEKKGCTIWHRAPSICREFDCRKSYAKHKDVYEIYQRGKELSEQ